MSVSGAALAARIPSVTARQLEYWISKGWVRPDNPGPAARGPGNGRAFSGRELRVLAVMARLVLAGLTPARASGVAREAVAAAGVESAAAVSLGDGITVLVHGI